jgi:hypothetical protein
MLPDSTAEETVAHVRKTWERGQAVLDSVHAKLGPRLADKLVSLCNGGVVLHKILGLMHDTCSTANNVAELMANLKAEKAKAREFLGDELFE